MREITLENGDTFQVRSLTRRQVKALSRFGFSHAGFEFPDDKEQYEKIFDALVATHVEPQDQLDMAESDLRAIFMGIIKETYGSKEEEKNSLRSGPTDQTLTASTCAETAEHAKENTDN